MARKRMVHPDLFTSETVASLRLSARYTWVGVWTYLDDAGRGKNNAQLVKAAVWPLDEDMSSASVRADLDALQAEGMLCAYSCCGAELLHVPAWLEFQKISHATPSRVCPCPVHDGAEHDAHALLRDSGVSPERLRSGSGKTLHNVVELSSDQSSSSAPAPIPGDFRERVQAARQANHA